MRALIAGLTIAIATPAWAQTLVMPPSDFNLPTTVPLTNKGERIGTMTFIGNRVYLRDLKDEHYATIEIGRDGSRIAYDADGNVIQKIEAKPK